MEYTAKELYDLLLVSTDRKSYEDRAEKLAEVTIPYAFAPVSSKPSNDLTES